MIISLFEEVLRIQQHSENEILNLSNEVPFTSFSKIYFPKLTHAHSATKNTHLQRLFTFSWKSAKTDRSIISRKYQVQL